MKKQPEQTAKTRQLMIDAFWELAKENGIDKVSISGITKKAGYNRGTFYVYFADMPDLIAQAEDDMIHDIQGKMRVAAESGEINDFEIVSHKIVDLFARYDEKLYLLIGKNGDPNFRAVLQNEATKVFCEVFKSISNTENSEYIVAFITSAFMGVLTHWHETGKRIDTTELGKIIHSMITKGLMGTMQRQ